MRVLIYKRTHCGDPSKAGHFGIHNCMGRVRNWNYNAVVGIGGIGSEAVTNGIDRKLNWVGIGPHKTTVAGKPGVQVTFDHFLYYGAAGPLLRSIAPTLARRIYRDNVRVVLSAFNDTERAEIQKILRLAAASPASKPLGYGSKAQSTRCERVDKTAACRPRR